MTRQPAAEGGTLTIRLPLVLKKRGGRKLMLAPSGTDRISPRVDNAAARAIARAFRWRELLESGAFSTIEEIASAEGINPSYVSRVLRLSLLAPAIVEAILDGRQSFSLRLDLLMKPFPTEWAAQFQLFGEGP